jgi:hypothetical protein
MTQSELFKALGAPLSNVRWSWEAIRLSDGSVFLRVWQDLTRKQDGRLFAEVTHRWKFDDASTDPGNQERLSHVERIRQGATCYLIMCKVVDASAVVRKIEDFDSEDLYLGGELIKLDNDLWIELRDRVPVRQIMPSSPPP